MTVCSDEVPCDSSLGVYTSTVHHDVIRPSRDNLGLLEHIGAGTMQFYFSEHDSVVGSYVSASSLTLFTCKQETDQPSHRGGVCV